MRLQPTSLDNDHKRKCNPILIQKIVRKKDEEPRKTSKDIKAKLQGQGMSQSDHNIHCFLNNNGLLGRIPRRTPLLKEKCETARNDCAKTYADKPKTFCQNGLWIDETQLELFGKSHQLYTHRQENEAFLENTTSPVKHGGGLGLFLGYFAASGMGGLEYQGRWAFIVQDTSKFHNCQGIMDT